ncbi:MAG: dihydropteroate synthase [Pseudomonadales bacterium]|nr:dihydropteroate synthase [Pseudomonadales bacterium]
MGILNITPDSFSDGGLYQSPSDALRAAELMVGAGAAIIDVGGESTRPGAKPISLEQELNRVIPVIESLARNIDVLISVDTSSPLVIREACRVGAGLINDVRSLAREGALGAARETGLPVCLMHMQGRPETMQGAPSYRNVVTEVLAFLDERVEVCRQAGIAHDKILLDPGIGFGKSLADNLCLLKNLETLVDRGLPVLLGASRKSMIGAVINRNVDERLYGGLAIAALAASKGVKIIRTHDVAATVDAVKMADAISTSVLHCQ